MTQYLNNLRLWAAGWRRFGEVDFKDGWAADQLRWRLLYLLDYGACVLLLAGGVESVSAFMHRHRSGWLNDKVLDVLEVVDARHGRNAGPPLFGSAECSRRVRLLVPAFWSLLLIGALL